MKYTLGMVELQLYPKHISGISQVYLRLISGNSDPYGIKIRTIFQLFEFGENSLHFDSFWSMIELSTVSVFMEETAAISGTMSENTKV